MNTFRNGDKVYTLADIEKIEQQLAKANEREKEFIAYMHDAQKWFDKHDPNRHLQSSHPEAIKALNKFAIEKKIEALESLNINPNNESEDRVVAIIEQRIEQLRKEQE